MKKSPTSKVPAKYDPSKIEPKWQKKWASSKIYASKEPAGKNLPAGKNKYYVLDMFPYPSGEGLHVGHPKGYIATDVISRIKRMQGFNVLHPMGFDAFGLPAENYAIKTKTNPEIAVKKNIARFKKQLEIIGLDYDWSREVNTTDPAYYRWTQWIFLQLFKKGLAYESNEPVNWCPTDKTVLANEDVENGRCERCGTPVEKKPMRQWVLRITDYADRLLNDLDAAGYVMPKVVDKTNPHRPGAPLVKRNVAHAIVYDPKNKKYLIIRNKKFGWDTVVIGGIEDGESPVDTARREVMEETGYTDLEFKKILGGPVENWHYTKHKGQNRIAIAQAAYFELKSDKRIPVATDSMTKDEAAHNEILWIDEKDFVPGKMVNTELPIWLERLNAYVTVDEKTGVLCFNDWGHTSAVRDGLPFVERNAVAAIVKHWKEDKYIGLKWKQVAWQTIITGGPDGKETPEEGAIKEIIEETGYLHPKLIRHIGNADSKFFHNPKNVNRYAHFDVMYFELSDGEKNELSPEEQSKHEVVWLTKEEMSDFLSPAAQRYMWDILFLNKPDRFSPPKPLLDWPESIKEAQRNWIGRSEGALIDFPIKQDTNFVLIHGWEGSPERDFFPWLKAVLEKAGYKVQVPSLPNSKDPVVKDQVEHVLKTCKFDEKTVLFGHSLGCTVAMKVVERLPGNISKLVLAAPFIENHFKDGSTFERKAHDWKYDFGKIRSKAKSIVILRDLTDPVVPDDQAGNIKEKLGGIAIDFKAVEGHITAKEEPFLLEMLVPKIEAFTTRPDTLFGVTYVVLAPEHRLVNELLGSISNKVEVEAYINRAKNKTEIERTDVKREKTGVELKGVKAVNPANNEEVPVWIADYVLADYGTGAVMAVPAHDERDWEFAKSRSLRIRGIIDIGYEEIDPNGNWAKNNPWVVNDYGSVENLNKRLQEKRKNIIDGKTLYTHETKTDKLVNSGEFNGLGLEDAKKKITDRFGQKKITYKLRDWVFSRQRYWGEPIPLIHCEKCGVVPVPEKDLPVKLPKVKSYEPTGTGESPLAAIKSWVNVKCPKCKGLARRETNTMPQWAGSCWYYLRYEDPKNKKALVDPKKERYWSPVDLYVGGAEHATRHLIYARFWHKFLNDIGVVSYSEPFTKLQSVGLIMGEDGRKMSKRFGNVVNPDDIVKQFGADTLRIYEMFMGPFDQAIAWSTESMVGPRRFIEKVWRLGEKVDKKIVNSSESSEEGSAAARTINKAIKKVTDDIICLRFNTAISTLMIACNELEKTFTISRAHYESYLKLLAPFAPHVTEELWISLGNKKSIHISEWPTYDPKSAVDEESNIIVQINGKVRASFKMAADSSEEALKAAALAMPEVKKWLEGKQISKIIVVKGRLISIVAV